MGKKPRFWNSSKLNRTLKLIFILSCMLFFLVFNYSNTSDCNSCKFDYQNKVISFDEAMTLYQNACLANRIAASKGVYVNIDNITLNKTVDGMYNITFPQEAIQDSP